MCWFRLFPHQICAPQDMKEQLPILYFATVTLFAISSLKCRCAAAVMGGSDFKKFFLHMVKILDFV